MSILRHLARRLQRGKIPIIMVHGVFDEPLSRQHSWNPTGKHLHAGQLEGTLKELTQHFKPLSLHTLIERQQQNDWPQSPSFALTFDDGYSGFEDIVLPLLEKYQCPASFFPVVDFVDGHPLWMDRVEFLILRCDNFTSPQGQLLPAMDSLKSWKTHFKSLNTKEREDLLTKYFSLPDDEDLPGRRQAVSWDELRRLNEHPLVSIGNHTLTHPILANENDEVIRGEILGAAERLRHELGTCDLFCYPNGTPDDHNATTRQVVIDTHHQLALTTSEELVQAHSDPYTWPRFSLSANTFGTRWFQNGIWGLRDLKKRFWK